MVTSGRVTLDGLAFVELVAALGSALDAQRDTRQAHKVSYALSDAGLAAFAVFFMQSPSFLAFQRSMLASSGASNAQTLFDMRAIPTDTHVRDLLDGVPSEALFVLFRHAYRSLLAAGALNAFRTSTKRLLVVIDGTEYFSSDRVHCAQCSTREHAGGVRYAHSVITPVIASPNQREVIGLEPAFISPQDGELKQDCELNAARRWLRTQAPEYELGAAIVIADDLYSHQPFCQAVLDAGHDFVLVCKPQSHRTLTEYLELGGVTERTERSWNGRHGEIRAYRFASGLPLRDGNAALLVNWCELSVTHETSGQQLYRNSFITSLPVSASNVADVIAWGAVPLEDREREQQHPENQGLPLRA